MELTPHDGITNEKIAKAQIGAVEQKQNEYEILIDLADGESRQSCVIQIQDNDAESGSGDYRGKIIAVVNLETRTTYSVDVEKGCYYEQALNMTNFIKQLRRRGIISPMEVVVVK